MFNFNGKLVLKEEFSFSPNNRGLKFGDSIFETIKLQNNKVVFAEDHYFRLMASIRMVRMEIPLEMSLAFFENEIIKTAQANNLKNARVRFTVFRKPGGLYMPLSNKIDYFIEINEYSNSYKEIYEVEIFKDFYVYSGLLSTLKSNNKLLNVVASVFQNENNLDNCFLLNEKKNLVEAINANVFLIKGQKVVTPPLTDGCLKGIIRKKVIELLKEDDELDFEEIAISPFELQKADEVFITNAIVGIQPVTKFKRKSYNNEVSLKIKEKLEHLI